MNAIKRFTNIIWILVLTFGLFNFNVQSASAATDCDRYYTVQRGDYLSQIAREYGVSWRYLADINNLSNPSRIYTGQRLCVDAGDSNTNTGTGSSTNTGSGARARVTRVVEDDYAIVAGTDLPRNTRVDVLFGKRNASVANSIRVGGVTTDRYGEFEEAFDIPERLRDVAQISITIVRGHSIYAEAWFYNEDYRRGSNNDDDDDDGGDLDLDVIRVEEEFQVTVQASGFPKSTKFEVLMADRDESPLKWIEADVVSTGNHTSFSETFRIPRDLRNADEISIRFKSEDGKYDVSTWFDNEDQDNDRDDEDEDDPDFAFLQPIEVIRNEEVTIRFTELQAGVEYDVLMGRIGTRGEDGIYVGSVVSNRGGTVVDTFDIPSSLRGSSRIAIRIETSRGYAAYNWFTNQTTD